MAETQGGKELEVRIARIEKMLEGLTTRREAMNLTAEEIKAYQKVRDVIAVDWGDFCGINDCFRCIIPCVRCRLDYGFDPRAGAYGYGRGAALGRFGGLGE